MGACGFNGLHVSVPIATRQELTTARKGLPDNKTGEHQKRRPELTQGSAWFSESRSRAPPCASETKQMYHGRGDASLQLPLRLNPETQIPTQEKTVLLPFQLHPLNVEGSQSLGQ